VRSVGCHHCDVIIIRLVGVGSGLMCRKSRSQSLLSNKVGVKNIGRAGWAEARLIWRNIFLIVVIVTSSLGGDHDVAVVVVVTGAENDSRMRKSCRATMCPYVLLYHSGLRPLRSTRQTRVMEHSSVGDEDDGSIR